MKTERRPGNSGRRSFYDTVMENPATGLQAGIRLLREGEMAAASALIRRVFAEFEAPEYAPQGTETFYRFIAPEALAEQLRRGTMLMWGAFRQQTPVGIIALTHRDHISLLFVDKSCHRRGIARALFARACESCRTEPAITRLTVNSSPYAVDIYRKLGFSAIGPERTTDGIRYTPMEYHL